jgi:hypothetical protein
MIRQPNLSTTSLIALEEAQMTTNLVCKIEYVDVWIYVEFDVNG